MTTPLDAFDRKLLMEVQRDAQIPQNEQCYYVAGEWDFVLVLTVRNMDQYNDLTRQLFFSNNNVKRFKTLVSMSRVKVGLEVPVVDDD